MKPIFIFALLCIFVFAACSQQDTADACMLTANHSHISIGQSTVSLRQYRTVDSTPFLLLHLHSNELSAGKAASTAACRWGTEFLQLLNNRERMISFHYGGQLIQFDPNRIFSAEGTRKTLEQSGYISNAAFVEVQRFSDSLLTFVNKHKTIVAVHNNTDGRFNIRQYLQIDPERVHINESQDEDNFFITNDAAFFMALKAENYNVVWEDAAKMEEDGSLSLYCQRNSIRYINVEAEHGRISEQLAMLEVVKQIVDREKKFQIFGAKSFGSKKHRPYFCTPNNKRVDLVAQLVEQYTFNVWALGSSPSGITE